MGLATAHPSIRHPIHRARNLTSLRRFRWYILIPALYTSLTIVLLWPLVAHVTTAVADTLGDPLLNAWTLRWVQHALITDPAHLYDGNMFAPNARSLAFSELLLPQAIMAWPIWLVTHDALLAYNLSVLITYPTCALGMYALCRALGANRGSAFIGGIFFAFAPFRLDNNAHLQVLSMQWMPLALLAVIRYMQRPSRWRFVAVACVAMLVGLSSVYYLIMFGTGLALFIFVETIRQRGIFLSRRVLPSRAMYGLIGALALAGVIVAVIDVPYVMMRREQHITRTLDEAYDNSAHRTSYLTVTPGSFIWSGILPASNAERAALFPGAFALILSVAGLGAIRRPWMAGLIALGALSLVLSFGPTTGDKEHGTPLPYRLLYEHVTGYKGIRGPDRFAALVMLALCPLAAVGATRLWRAAVWRRPALRQYGALVAIAIGCLAIGESATRLLPTMPVDRSVERLAPYRWLASQPDAGIVAEFPTENGQLETSFYSTYHWQRVLWGHSGFIPAATYQVLGRFRGGEDYPGTDDLGALADMGVGTMVIHRSAFSPDILTGIERGLAGASNVSLVGTIGDSDIYRLLPEAPAPLLANVSFTINPYGNIDKLTGAISITNTTDIARMLYTHGYFDIGLDVRDAAGKRVSFQRVQDVLPAVIPRGTTSLRISVELPRAPGRYSIGVHSANVPILNSQPRASVDVVSVDALPHLALRDNLVTSPPLYTVDEKVAMWVTTKDGKTVPLPDTVALADRTLHVTVPTLPPGAAAIVAHGKVSGVELWVAPP